MKEFQIEIKETHIKTVTVEVESVEKAWELVKRNWKNGDYILDADNFKGVVFTIPT